jgi:hypothetical protein
MGSAGSVRVAVCRLMNARQSAALPAARVVAQMAANMEQADPVGSPRRYSARTGSGNGAAASACDHSRNEIGRVQSGDCSGGGSHFPVKPRAKRSGT